MQFINGVQIRVRESRAEIAFIGLHGASKALHRGIRIGHDHVLQGRAGAVISHEPLHVLDAGQLNAYDVLVSDDIVFTKAAYESFVAAASGSKQEDAK